MAVDVNADLRVGRLTIPAAELAWRYDTAGGPGGQHANRAATRVELRFDVAGSPSLGEDDRARLVARVGRTVVVTAADSRSQSRNRELAYERLRTQLGEALKPERTRRPSKPSRRAKARRVDAKKQRSALKRTRGRVRPDD
jgi:ribosome-associated protein